MNPHKIIPCTYLFSGDAELDDNGELVPKLDAVKPICNKLLFCKDDASERIMPWKTNNYGVLRQTFDGFEERNVFMRGFRANVQFSIPSPDIVSYSWASQGEKWGETISNFLNTDEPKNTFVDIQMVRIEKRHLKEPENNPKTENEREYSKWYQSITDNDILEGYFILKIHGIIIFFSDNSFEKADVTMDYLGEDKKVEPLTASIRSSTVNGDKLYLASVLESSDKFPKGMYKTKITKSNPQTTKQKWAEEYQTQEGFSYEFVEKLRFSLSTPVCDFDIILGDPISLEESMMVQFPVLYNHLLESAKKKERYEEMKEDDVEKKTMEKIPPLPKALDSWANRYLWCNTKTKLLVESGNADSRMKKMDTLVNLLIPSKHPMKVWYDRAAKIGFGYVACRKAWKNFAKAKDIYNFVDALVETADATKPFRKLTTMGRWHSNLMDFDFSKAKLLRLKRPAGMAAKNWEFFQSIANGANRCEIVGALAKTAKVAGKALFVADQVATLYELYKVWEECIGTRNKLTSNKETFSKLIECYSEEIGACSCREGIGNLERIRATTISGYIDVDVKTAQAIMKTFDVALGYAAMVPVPVYQQLLGAIIATKALAEAGYDGISAVCKEADERILNNYFAAIKEDGKLKATIQQGQIANQKLMYESHGDDADPTSSLEVQFRMRAEALNGLCGLLTRAAISSPDDTIYLKKIEKYRIHEYIETYILNDQWQIPIRPSVPLGMDVFWLYARNPFSLLWEYSQYRARMGMKNKLTLAMVATFPSAMPYMVVAENIPRGQVKAAFKKHFPIHCVDSGLDENAIKDFALAFRTSFNYLDKKCVAYTQVYYRKKKDDAWKPVVDEEKTEKLVTLSPLYEIRVLVVLNKDIEDSIYPISLQLIRTDMIPDISGPVYKDIVKKLDTSLLEEEAEWKGRLGCVIYPFYQLGHETIPGIKPMATKIALRGVGFYYSIGGLKDMTYAFRVKVGGERTKDWLKLGGTENQRSKLDDMKVTIDVVKNEKEKKLLVPEFLVERDGDPVYPKLFKAGRNGVGAVIIGAGTGPEIILDANGNKKWDDFDWSKSFECTFIFWSEHVSSDDWDKLNLDWMHTPVQLKLRQDISFGGDKSGPHYSGRLTYMGTLKMNGSGQNANYIFRRGNDVATEGLQKLMACLESSTQIQTIGSAMGIDQPAVGAGLYQYHLFAAHFSFEYTTKEGKKVKSIRPFGKYISPGNYYKYYFTIASPTGIGGLESEARFLLKAPGSSENVPWERATEKDWIEKDAEKVDASIRIVAE